MILALDPSLTCFGWLVADESGRVANYGAIVTEPESKKRHIYQGDDDARRAALLIGQLGILVRQYGVTAIASEQPAGSKSAVSAKALGIAMAAVVATAEYAGVEIRWVRAVEAKVALTRSKAATKDRMVEFAKHHGVAFNGTKPCREAVADALGVLLASGLWRPPAVAYRVGE